MRLILREEGEFLVRLARRSVEEYLTEGRFIDSPGNVPPSLQQPRGVFVTINIVEAGRKKLRGCIGFPYPTKPVVDAVIECAVKSATGDPRFTPLTEEWLSRIVFEVSVLTPPQLVVVDRPEEYSSRIEVGRDGLIVESGLYKGLLLPQVPVEWGWSEEEFLGQCCVKAGLTADCWLDKGTKIFRFQCQVFGEDEPKGTVNKTM